MDLLFYLTLLFFILIFGSLDNNIDFDFWARLVVGKNFFQTGNILRNDFLSYGSTHEFIDHEWGSSVIFYIVQKLSGDVGIFIFKSLMIFATLYIIIRIIKLKKPYIKLNFLFFFFALQAISYNIFSTIRCQTFSFFFFALYIYILEKSKKNHRILWCLPVLNVVWANMHGGFSLGLILILIYALGEALNKKPCRCYFITFFISTLTTLINPYGIKYIYFIISALNLDRIYITEWQSAFFNDAYKHSLLKYKLFFFPCIILFCYSIIKRLKSVKLKEFYLKVDKTKYLIIIFCMLISLKSIRFHVFFVYAVLAFCYADFYEIFNKKLPEKIDNIKETIIFILISISLISHIYSYKFVNEVKPSQYPVFCIEFIKENNLKGNLFVNFHTGSYSVYKLYPNNHIFMDGRYEEVYDENLINEMADFFLAKNYKDFLNKYHTDILILDKRNYPIADILRKDTDWFSAYEDDNYALFLPSKYKNHKFKTNLKTKEQINKDKFQTNINWI